MPELVASSPGTQPLLPLPGALSGVQMHLLFPVLLKNGQDSLVMLLAEGFAPLLPATALVRASATSSPDACPCFLPRHPDSMVNPKWLFFLPPSPSPSTSSVP